LEVKEMNDVLVQMAKRHSHKAHGELNRIPVVEDDETAQVVHAVANEGVAESAFMRACVNVVIGLDRLDKLTTVLKWLQ
jgi:hypothetical protein